MKRQIDLANLHYALITKDDETGFTYDTPVPLSRAIKVNMKVIKAEQDYYSEGGMEGTDSVITGVEIEIEVNQLSIAERAALQGSTSRKGGVVDNKNDVAPELAFGFESKRGDGQKRLVWLYKGKFGNTDDSYESVSDKITGQTNTIKGKFYPRINDDNIRYMLDTDAPDADATVIANWFTAVQEMPAADVG